MNLHRNLLKSTRNFWVTALLVTSGTVFTYAQQGVVDDWSTHHIKFSNPGTEMDALMQGRRAEWQRIVNDPRYRAQQIRRSAAWATRFASAPLSPEMQRKHEPAPVKGAGSHLERDWSYAISAPYYGTYPGTYPAKYSFDINATPTCSDYVVFPVWAYGSSSQANLAGFNNLYDGTCPSSGGSGQPFAPTVKFAYYVSPNNIRTSPVLSEDGTKVAFVECCSSTSGATFHVLTLGTSGSNGSAYNSPVQPHTVIINGVISTNAGTSNNAIDTQVTLNGAAVDFNSSPFVDYANDVAYWGDTSGKLHKFTGVFNGTPTEANTGGWPFTVASGATLSGPVLDSAVGYIYVGANDSYLYCINVSGGTPQSCSHSREPVSGVVADAPIVVSNPTSPKNGWVFTLAIDAVCTRYSGNTCTYDAKYSVLTQVNFDFPITTSVGAGGFNAYQETVYAGDFDNSYYNDPFSGSGYMYFCATPSSGNLTLYRVGFIGSGQINGMMNPNSLAAVSQLEKGFPYDPTPLTEVYNDSEGKDYLFLGVTYDGAPSGCNGVDCVMSFELPSGNDPFPAGPNATYPSNPGFGSGFSGIIVDNVSTQSGASQIYFSNLNTGSGTQASQSGLN